MTSTSSTSCNIWAYTFVVRESLERLESELVLALAGLDARQSQWAPRAYPGKWNVQQIVEHLLLTYSSTTALLQTRLAKGTPTRSRANLRQRLGQLVLLRLGSFPAGRLAPPEVSPTLPSTSHTGEELAQQVRRELARMGQAALAAEQLFGTRKCASHGVLGPLSIAEWMRFHLVHGRHHVKQIQRIRLEHGSAQDAA